MKGKYECNSFRRVYHFSRVDCETNMNNRFMDCYFFSASPNEAALKH